MLLRHFTKITNTKNFLIHGGTRKIWGSAKSVGHPLGTMDADFSCNLSNSCWDVSIWTKVVDHPTEWQNDITIPRTTKLEPVVLHYSTNMCETGQVTWSQSVHCHMHIKKEFSLTMTFLLCLPQKPPRSRFLIRNGIKLYRLKDTSHLNMDDFLSSFIHYMLYPTMFKKSKR